jgi:hypothetical protein
MELPAIGILELEDAETGRTLVVDTWDRRVRERFAAEARDRAETRRRLFRQNKVDAVELTTGQPYDVPLVRFFHERARRMR